MTLRSGPRKPTSEDYLACPLGTSKLSEKIQLTRALIAQGLLQAVQSTSGKGLIPLDMEVQRELMSFYFSKISPTGEKTYADTNQTFAIT